MKIRSDEVQIIAGLRSTVFVVTFGLVFGLGAIIIVATKSNKLEQRIEYLEGREKVIMALIKKDAENMRLHLEKNH